MGKGKTCSKEEKVTCGVCLPVHGGRGEGGRVVHSWSALMAVFVKDYVVLFLPTSSLTVTGQEK